MMRSFITGVSAAVVTLLAMSVNAATVSVVWTAVDGSTIAPTDNITVLTGQTLEATLYLDGTADGGIQAYSISAEWDGGPLPVLGNVSAEEFLPGDPCCIIMNISPGTIDYLTDSGPGIVGQALGFEAYCDFCVIVGNFPVGTLTFTALNAGSTTLQTALIQPHDDITATLAGTSVGLSSTYLSADVTVVPEPTAASLLSLGLLGLGLIGHQRNWS